MRSKVSESDAAESEQDSDDCIDDIMEEVPKKKVRATEVLKQRGKATEVSEKKPNLSQV